jgi:hypothetical protein
MPVADASVTCLQKRFSAFQENVNAVQKVFRKHASHGHWPLQGLWKHDFQRFLQDLPAVQQEAEPVSGVSRRPGHRQQRREEVIA